jgi:hypothetical protein
LQVALNPDLQSWFVHRYMTTKQQTAAGRKKKIVGISTVFSPVAARVVLCAFLKTSTRLLCPPCCCHNVSPSAWGLE